MRFLGDASPERLPTRFSVCIGRIYPSFLASEQRRSQVGKVPIDGSLRCAQLDHAYLNGMNLQGADLREADLRNATLTCTDLRDANLRQANLQNACLYIAKYNQATRWPEDIDPAARGALRF